MNKSDIKPETLCSPLGAALQLFYNTYAGSHAFDTTVHYEGPTEDNESFLYCSYLPDGMRIELGLIAYQHLHSRVGAALAPYGMHMEAANIFTSAPARLDGGVEAIPQSPYIQIRCAPGKQKKSFCGRNTQLVLALLFAVFAICLIIPRAP